MDSTDQTDDTTSETASATPARVPQLRIPSLWSQEQIEAMDLTIFRDKKAFNSLPPKEKNFDLAAFMWVHHVDHDEDAIEAAVAGGTWRDEVKRFHRDPRSLAALVDVEPTMEVMMRMMGKGK